MNKDIDASSSTPERNQHNCAKRDPIPETLNQQGAMALAKRLEKFWHDQGYPAARFWAEPVGERFAKVGTYEIYRVACNLVDGLPPRYADQRPKA